MQTCKKLKLFNKLGDEGTHRDGAGIDWSSTSPAVGGCQPATLFDVPSPHPPPTLAFLMRKRAHSGKPRIEQLISAWVLLLSTEILTQ